jgi:ABC-type branched-subunit amino acid transport system substrate-binding protein
MHVLLLLLSLSIAATVSSAQAESENSDLLFGMSTALSGPASALGSNMREGFLAAFERRNRDGGWRGKKLRLWVLDDRYEPRLTVQNMRQLVADPQLLAIVGNVGTPTAIAALPIIAEEKILFYAPFTGAGVLRRQPPSRYVINYRASYAEEVAAMVDALVEVGGLELSDIAFFTQRDGYGDAGFYGGVKALKRHGLMDESSLLHVRYERNTLAVENALADILFAEHQPKAVIVVGAYAPVAKFIRLARKLQLNSLFLNVSFVGSRPLRKALGANIDGVIVTQVVPHPETSQLMIVQEYRNDLATLGPALQPSFGGLEGYVAGRIILKALDSLNGDPKRESLVDALEALGEFDLGIGRSLHLDKTRHQASHRVWPTLLSRQGFVPFSWNNITELLKAEGSP